MTTDRDTEIDNILKSIVKTFEPIILESFVDMFDKFFTNAASTVGRIAHGEHDIRFDEFTVSHGQTICNEIILRVEKVLHELKTSHTKHIKIDYPKTDEKVH